MLNHHFSAFFALGKNAKKILEDLPKDSNSHHKALDALAAGDLAPDYRCSLISDSDFISSTTRDAAFTC